MRTLAQHLLRMTLLGLLTGLWCVLPGLAFPVAPPPETLAGLRPGISTVGDGTRIFGDYDTRLPGNYLRYAGGPAAAHAYRWTNGYLGKLPGLILETEIGSPVVAMVVVDRYPGLSTSRGLMALTSEECALDIYGFPDYVFEISFGYGETQFRELYYIDQGILVVLGQVEGRPNWTIVKLILTYPTYLRNAVSARTSAAMSGHRVEDITQLYRAWVGMAY